MICKYSKITKRDGSIVDFDDIKIVNAIYYVFKEVNGKSRRKDAKGLSEKVIEALNSRKEETLSVEEVQDFVEAILMQSGFFKEAKAYILYRDSATKERDKRFVYAEKLVSDYLENADWRVKENANSSYSFPSLLNHVSGAVLASYALNRMYPKHIANAHNNGDIHIHDLSCSIIGYCCGWSLKDLLLRGFTGVSGRASAKPAKHFDTALLQIINFLMTQQTESAGAQALNSVDTLLAPFVRKDNLSYHQVKQCMQQMIFGLNIAARMGQCVPEETQMLSVDKGWVSVDDVKVGDAMYVYDKETGKLKTDFIKHITLHDNDKPLHRYYNDNGFEMLVTDKHRVLYKKGSNELRFALSEELLNTKTPVDIPTSAPVDTLDYTISDDLLEFLVFILCDGCVWKPKNKPSYNLSFWKSDKRWGKERLEELCASLQIPFTKKADESGFASLPVNCTSTYPMQFYYFTQSAAKDKILDLLNYTKKSLPAFFKKLSARQCELVIHTWGKLDGCKKGSSFKLQCDNEAIQDALQEVAVRAGFTTKKFARFIGNNKKPTLYLSVHTNKYRTCKVDEVAYNGRVWCITTDTGTIVARHNGRTFITGNCPFTNMSFDWVVPDDMKEEPIVIDGAFSETETYESYQPEMDMINKAFIEVMMEGDADGKLFAFPIPTYNVTKDFNWDSENADLLFKMTALYGIPYFQNFVNSELDPSDVRSMCCRLSLSLSELRKKTGGLFGSGDNTGSIGVCTINLAKLGYLSSSVPDLYDRLDSLLDIAKDSLEIKRDYVNRNFQNGLMPYTALYLKNFDNHFSTIGVVGGNEMCLNLIGEDLTHPDSIKLVQDVLNYMRDKILLFQEETGHLYNLEATPAEGTSHRLARIDKKRYPDIIQASSEVPYYTNSTQLPVNYTDDVYDYLDLQEDIQVLYTGGSVVHIYIGEEITAIQAKHLVKTICEKYRVPYISITPTFSICPEHGYIPGEHFTCPYCK